MAAHVFANNGLVIFDATWAVITLNSTCQPVYHIRNVVTITNPYVLPNDGASPPRETPQLDIIIQVAALT